MKRRTFLQLTTAGAIATITPAIEIIIPSCTTGPANPAIPTALNTPQFLASICDSQTIRKIGTDYRTSTPAEAKEPQLKDLLTGGLDQTKAQDTQLAARIKADFAAGRTVTLEGWVISITEARQCALYSIQLP